MGASMHKKLGIRSADHVNGWQSRAVYCIARDISGSEIQVNLNLAASSARHTYNYTYASKGLEDFNLVVVKADQQTGKFSELYIQYYSS